MAQTFIEYNNKKYEMKTLTIEMWGNIMKYQGILDDIDLYVKMISEMTGLTSKEVKDANAEDIIIAGEQLHKFINQESKEIYPEIRHNGIEYTMVDVHKISFGQFVDIDTFMSKDEAYKSVNLNELAAYLYTEKGKKYGEVDFKKTIDNFKDLPVKYVEGAVFFLWTLERALQDLSQVYSKNKLTWEIIKLKVASHNFGVTISGLVNSQKTKFGKLMLLLLSPLFFVLIIFLTLWIFVVNKIKKLKNK
jgi:hypothetical protein